MPDSVAREQQIVAVLTVAAVARLGSSGGALGDPARRKRAHLCGFHRPCSAPLHRHDVIRIERVITDNHLSSQRSAAIAEVIDANHLFIKPHCPWRNGEAERYNRTLQAE